MSLGSEEVLQASLHVQILVRQEKDPVRIRSKRLLQSVQLSLGYPIP